MAYSHVSFRFLAPPLAALALIAALAFTASPAQAANCRDVHRDGITGKEVQTGPGLGCAGARRVMKQYFDMVLASVQTPGGCAFERERKGCQVGEFRCYTIYKRSTNELRGVCKSGRGKVRFREYNRGPG